MKVAIHQPQYFPWPRYIHKVMSADVFVYLDTVQLNKNGLQNRNQVRNAQGPVWLTLPMRQGLGQRIADVSLADSSAAARHFKTLQSAYAKAPGFVRWRDELQALLSAGTTSLCEMAIASTEWLLDKVGATAKRIRASELGGGEERASAMVANICKQVGADRYLTGAGSLAYMEREYFDAAGCAVWVQEWAPFTYTQIGKGDFIPDLSTLDLLLNAPDEAETLIRRAGSWREMWHAVPAAT